MLYPIIPMDTAIAIEITTQIVAILLDKVSFLESSIAINLNKI